MRSIGEQHIPATGHGRVNYCADMIDLNFKRMSMVFCLV